ncbi:Outer membrane protein beta-barrel family protein [Belliella buryatensis]|uniref:Outer membrane protein beta-barrel family protein n=1 Tax=Belliella buryatensis TaxID=1500549 RepID=A0A239ESL7_9BACT|nr:outer membrane beta-barrel family protein [Belliella buryatensis]SNS47750.1 Outer membrane protein beta-barrel family protein [Belliella buryatensis]
MKKLITCIFLLLLSASIHATAQNSRWSFMGKLQDSQSEPLRSATVTLLSPSDSTLLAFGISDAKGEFEIRNITEQVCLVQVTFMGMETFYRLVERPENALSLDMGIIQMKESTAELEEVTIQDIAPITIKKDTIEYHADAFKTQPNANVEELLKRLPGVEVDQEGNIKAQGETVNRILVDGKEFFGTDPKLATKNLLAEAIEKVQILDRRSEQSQFTGIDDGQREKTINLKLKNDFKKGFFGNFTGAYGTDQRYKLQGNLNRFSENQQLSFLGLSNNINEQGFSITDYLNFQGGVQSMGGAGGQVRITVGGPGGGSAGIPINSGQRMNGIMDSHAYGANVNQDFSKKTQLRSSYFFNQLNHQISQDTDRLNFFPSGDFTFEERSIQDNASNNHRLNLILDHRIDSLNSFRSTNNAQFTQSDRFGRSETVNRDLSGNLLNRGNRTNLTNGDTYQANTEMLLRHRFNKPGHTISANLTFGINASDYEGFLSATNEFFGESPSVEVIEQENRQQNQALNYGSNVSYTSPLGGRKYLELVYNFRQNRSEVDRAVFDRVGENLVFNQALSNQFNAVYTYHRPGANVSYNAGKYNLVAGLALQATALNGELLLFDDTISNNFQNLLPSLRMNYSMSNTKNLMINYQTSVNEPNIEQLQPVINNADPLNIYVGNPTLRPAYNHRLQLNYNSFDMGKFINLFANGFANFTENAIVNAQSIDERQVRTITPVNVRSNMLFGGTVNLGFPIPSLNSRFNLGPNINYSNGYNQINELEDRIQINNLGGNLRYDFTWKDLVNFGFSSNISRQSTAYTFNAQQNQLFFNQNYNVELGLTFLEKYAFAANFNYLKFNSKTTDFNEAIPLLNISLSRFILKNNMGEIKLSGNNLLNQNIGVSQRADVNFIEQTVTNNLGRIIMLSFTYKLNSKLNPLNSMGRPGAAGPVRMIRM